MRMTILRRIPPTKPFSFFIPLLVKYADAALTTEINADDILERAFDLVSALACGRLSSKSNTTNVRNTKELNHCTVLYNEKR